MDKKVAQIVVGVAGALIAIGLLLPWLSVAGVFSTSQSGVGFTKFGVLIMLMGLGLASVGLVGLNVNRARLVFWVGVLAILVTGGIHIELSGRLEALNENELLVGSIGAGVWVVYAGAAIGIVVSALHLQENSAPLLGRAITSQAPPETFQVCCEPCLGSGWGADVNCCAPPRRP